jgi:hypothetical protein
MIKYGYLLILAKARSNSALPSIFAALKHRNGTKLTERGRALLLALLGACGRRFELGDVN